MLDGSPKTDDALVVQAAGLVVKAGRCSASMLQRQLSIGYNRAARLVDMLQDRGIVGAPDDKGVRAVATAEEIATVIATINDSLPKLQDAPTDARESEGPLGLPLGSTVTMNGKELTGTREEIAAAIADELRGGRPKMKQDPDFKAHNDRAFDATAEELRQFIERAEQLAAEKNDIGGQEKELFAEAKGRGYDTKAMRKIIALRKRKPDEVAEEEAVLDMYKAALGMI